MSAPLPECPTCYSPAWWPCRDDDGRVMRFAHASRIRLANILAEMRRLVDLLDGDCTMPDGSNADTSQAHAMLGDFAGGGGQ